MVAHYVNIMRESCLAEIILSNYTKLLSKSPTKCFYNSIERACNEDLNTEFKRRHFPPKILTKIQNMETGNVLENAKFYIVIKFRFTALKRKNVSLELVT